MRSIYHFRHLLLSHYVQQLYYHSLKETRRRSVSVPPHLHPTGFVRVSPTLYPINTVLAEMRNLLSQRPIMQKEKLFSLSCSQFCQTAALVVYYKGPHTKFLISPAHNHSEDTNTNTHFTACISTFLCLSLIIHSANHVAMGEGSCGLTLLPKNSSPFHLHYFNGDARLRIEKESLL